MVRARFQRNPLAGPGPERGGRLRLERAGAPSVHAIGFAALAAALLAAAAVLPIDAPPLSLFICPFRAATGLPCITCGASHAFAHAVRGELAAAFLSSPLAALLALACALHFAWTLARLCGLAWVIRAGRIPRSAVLAALAFHWLFTVARALA